jgi:hypothetical protein
MRKVISLRIRNSALAESRPDSHQQHNGLVMRQSKYTQLAVVALSPIAFSLFIDGHGHRIFSPSDGARLRLAYPWQGDGTVLSTIQEGAGGLQEGDIVVAVGGRSMEEWVQSLINFGAERPEWHVGQIVDYRVKRGEELLEYQSGGGTDRETTA